MKKNAKKRTNTLVALTSEKKRTVRLTDIAKQVGVAVSTVSRILNGAPNSVRVSEKTRELIFKTAVDLGYASHHIPIRYHKGIRSLMILSHNPGEIFYQQIISAVEMAVREKGYACYFSYTEGDPAKASDLIDAMAERFTAGCVIFQERDEVLSGKNKLKLKNLGIPCVLMDHHPVPCPDFVSTVELDNERAGYDIVEYLLKLGHSNFAFLGASTFSSCISRRKGVEQRLKEAELKLKETNYAVINACERFKLIKIFDSWKKSKEGFPTAIITANDDIGYAALNVLENNGIKVPDDVSIASFDDKVAMVSWGLDNVRTPLTSMRHPIELIGKTTAEILIDHIVNPVLKPARILLPGELMIRASTTYPKS